VTASVHSSAARSLSESGDSRQMEDGRDATLLSVHLRLLDVHIQAKGAAVELRRANVDEIVQRMAK
jgi:hypothetical protein